MMYAECKRATGAVTSGYTLYNLFRDWRYESSQVEVRFGVNNRGILFALNDLKKHPLYNAGVLLGMGLRHYHTAKFGHALLYQCEVPEGATPTEVSEQCSDVVDLIDHALVTHYEAETRVSRI